MDSKVQIFSAVSKNAVTTVNEEKYYTQGSNELGPFNGELREEAKKETLFQWDLCESSFTQQAALKTQHCPHQRKTFCMQSSSMWKKILPAPVGSTLTPIVFHTKERRFTCEDCDKCFTRLSDLKRHSRIHAACEMESKVKIFSQDSKNEVITFKEEKHHTEASSELGPFNGELCEKGNNEGPRKEKPFRCSSCGMTFTQPAALRRHDSIHTNEKSFACEVCGKRFSRKDPLKLHLLIHTGERPFACKDCDKRFSRLGHLRTHMLIHTEEKPYNCEVCDRSFRQIGAFKKHLLIHTLERPFTCELCTMSFSRKDNLKAHRLVHNRRMDYKCEQCEISFIYKASFKRHLLQHKGPTSNSVTCGTGLKPAFTTLSC